MYLDLKLKLATGEGFNPFFSCFFVISGSGKSLTAGTLWEKNPRGRNTSV